ncbi:MAG: class I SAM-dependent methyltransferase [Clostridia bacterium]|nr:class I SAM-dependent methyltransferase [Clostridia bacterium]
MNNTDKEFLLEKYAMEYGPEAGPWNLSLENKYLEYMITRFFDEHFTVGEGANICNIGIGAGCWDKCLSFKLKGGRLTSIDIDEIACRKLRLCLEIEQNPADVHIITSDVLQIEGLENCMDIVTMIGSTRMESGLYQSILNKAISFVKPGGSFYYQTLDQDENQDDFLRICEANGLTIEASLSDATHDIKAQYFKAVKPLQSK